MSAEQAGSEIQVGISNLSLDKLTLFTGGLAAYEDHLNALNPQDTEGRQIGLEVFTVRSRFMGRVMMRGHEREQRDWPGHQRWAAGSHIDMVDELNGIDRSIDHSYEDAVFGRIYSGHQSFLDETPGTGLHGLVLPHAQKSLNQLATVSWAVHGNPYDLDTIVYGQYLGGAAAYTERKKDATETKLWTPASRTLVQPKPADWEKFELSQYGDGSTAVSNLNARGINSIVWDTVHSHEFDSHGLLLSELLREGVVEEIHLSLNRQDMATDTRRGREFAAATAHAKRAFMKSPEAALRTVEGEVVQRIVAHWMHTGVNGRIVYEENPGLSNNKTVRMEQRAIIETTLGIIDQTKPQAA